MKRIGPQSREAKTEGAATGSTTQPRWWLLFALPTTAILVLYLAPLILGLETLYLRDVFSAHLPLKAAQHLPSPPELAGAEVQPTSVFPAAVAPRIAGGQPLLGNLNAVSLYPNNLLYRVAPTLWSLNAHFWIHWLLAPWGVWWLGRVFGLSHAAAWAGASAYAASGFFASQMNLYNLVAGSALAPFLAAALVVAVAPRKPGKDGQSLEGRLPGMLRRPWDLVLLALLWWLMLLAGDPMLAALALLLALIAALCRHGLRETVLAPRVWFPAALAGLAGTLMAAPQLLAMSRILPLSARAAGGLSSEEVLRTSFKPLMALDWLLPFAFGRPDRLAEGRFWAAPLYDGIPPLFYTLYPGILAFALAVAGMAIWALSLRARAAQGREKSPPSPGINSVSTADPLERSAQRRLGLFALLILSGGLFFALGAANPMVRWLVETFGGGGLRFPVKLWPAVSLGSALFAALGAEAFLRRGPKSLLLALAPLAAIFTAALAFLLLTPELATELLRGLVPASWPDAFVASERTRWLSLSALSLGLLATFAALIVATQRRPRTSLALLLALHWATQLALLSPTLPTDAAAPYSPEAIQSSPLAQHLPPSSRIVHGSYDRLFGAQNPAQEYSGIDAFHDYNRRRAFEMAPMIGILAGRRYDLNLSPEGLSSFLTKAARDALRQGNDEQRLRLLTAWGVDRLLLHRPLAPAARPLARPLGQAVGPTRTITAYALDAAPPVSFLTRVSVAPSLSHALGRLSSPGFDPRQEVVLAGRELQRAAPGAVSTGASSTGDLEILALDRQRLIVELHAEQPGALVWQRSHLPLYRATVNGEEAPVEIANLHRMAVRLPAGHHRVEIAVEDSRQRDLALAILGVLLLLILALRSRPEAPAPSLREAA
ncbi:MAG: hypothetical protein AAGD01_00910 [Acidobacteriota bacterium]